MKNLRMATVIVVAVATFSVLNTHRATAEDISIGVGASGFSFGFDVGTVAFAYTDGYWDNDHHWHNWRNEREAREFAAQHADRYSSWKHTRDHDQGWRERDHDDRDHGDRDHDDRDHDHHG